MAPKKLDQVDYCWRCRGSDPRSSHVIYRGRSISKGIGSTAFLSQGQATGIERILFG